MNKFIRWVVPISVSACAVMLLAGCAAFPGGPTIEGYIYTGVTDPAQNLAVAVEPGPATKVGRAGSIGILGMVAAGDAGLEAAMKNGGITKVHHVDHKVESILGLWVCRTTIVYGE